EIGEIRKIYYSNEQIRKDLWGTFSGEVCLKRGEVILNQEKYMVKNMAEAVLKGVGFITERPYQNELMENLSVFDNISIPLQEKVKGYWVHNKYRRSVKDYISEMNLSKEKVRDMDSLQRQKIVYEKWLLYMPKILICDNPFADVDINMQELTMRMFQILRKRGIAILILTSNLHTMKVIPGKALYYYKGEAIGEEEIWGMIGQ
ncbi:hypothetical protein, partial [Muricomes intestini]|uniref:hypothetical protein n=1 Tax=Muricomes intestini TaxID=1796634 RepID=UPI002FE1501C